MTGKKKKSSPKDDLVDQLLDDVNQIAADPSIADESPFDSEGTVTKKAPAAPLGLEPLENRIESTQHRSENIWAQLEGESPKAKLGGGARKKNPEPEPDSESPFAALEQEVGSSDSPATPPGADPSEFLGDLLGPSVGEEGPYQGPSLDQGYQSLDDLDRSSSESPEGLPRFESAQGHENEATRQVYSSGDDKTMSIGMVGGTTTAAVSDNEATVAADGFAHRRVAKSEPQEKVVIGSLRGGRTGNVFTSMDASLVQAENLKIAQQRILELEKENDRLRQENEEVSSAADIIRSRLEELSARITQLEREKQEVQEAAHNEVLILKGNLQFKESEVAKARLKIDELETRLKSDFKKIRVKERELENRLELARAEKAALVRAKDESILELKRKVDQLQTEIDNYREKCLELNKTIESHQEQFKRTVRALRLALTNLEVKDENIVPLKKAD